MVVVPDSGRSFKVDPRKIRATPPKSNRTLERSQESRRNGGGRTKLRLGRNSDAGLDAHFEASKEQALKISEISEH